MITSLFVAAVAVLSQPTPASPAVPGKTAPTPESLVTREKVMANLEALPKARSPLGNIASQKGLIATEDLLVSRLKAMGYTPTLENLEWNLKAQGETEDRLRAEAKAKGQDASAVQSRGASETTPELAAHTWHNIIVEIPGTQLPREVMIVSAHFDAVTDSPGADDDGSGVAALLEAARVLKDHPMKRTVRMIFFNLEELPLLGSRQYVRDLKPKLKAGEEKVVGMVSLEMLGYFSDAPNSQRSPIPKIQGVFDPPTVGDFLGVLTTSAHSGFARQWAEGMAKAAPGLKLNIADMFPVAPPDFLRSDHGPFLLSGMPALMLTDTSNFRNSNYHKPTDTMQTLDPERLTLAAKGVVGGIRAVADGAAKPAEPTPTK